MALLNIQNLSVYYGERQIVSGFNLSLRKGEAVSLVGESGSGKSTIVRAVMGLLPEGAMPGKDSSIIFDDRDLINLPRDKWSKIRGGEISMIFQDSGNMLNPVRSVGSQFVEHIRHREKISNGKASEMAANALLKTGLGDPHSVLRAYPFQLSGGMRQRVGIAMAMIFNPRLLLADEPTSALDATTQKQVIDELNKIKASLAMSVILVTHNLAVAFHVSDRVLVLKNGKLIEEGPPNAIAENPKDPYTKELLDAVPLLKD